MGGSYPLETQKSPFFYATKPCTWLFIIALRKVQRNCIKSLQRMQIFVVEDSQKVPHTGRIRVLLAGFISEKMRSV
jgi:hypothetical protein